MIDYLIKSLLDSSKQLIEIIKTNSLLPLFFFQFIAVIAFRIHENLSKIYGVPKFLNIDFFCYILEEGDIFIIKTILILILRNCTITHEFNFLIIPHKVNFFIIQSKRACI